MKPNSKWHRLVAPGICAFLACCLFIALGIWQLHRLKWKEQIVQTIHQAAISDPVPLPAHPSPFQKIYVTGHWIPGKAALYGQIVHDSPHGPITGGELIMPFETKDQKTLLVDLGWVPQTIPIPLPQPNGIEKISGYIHAPLPRGFFSPPDDPGSELYYTLDPRKIAAGLGLKGSEPYILIAMGPLPPPGSPLPQPDQSLPTPPNNHYEYALTWFGFAFVLVFQFIFFARKRLLEP